jgi:hypothetical protein
MGKYTGKPYQPSNGTEGMSFEEDFCANCIHEKFYHTQKHGDKQCDIFNRAILWNPSDKEYPNEWQYDESDNPVCTAHVNWNWGSNDDEGGWNEPPPPEPYNPNQLVMPFIVDEIEEKSLVIKNKFAIVK